MKRIQILIVALLAIVVTSCTTYSYTSRSVSIAQSMDVQPTSTLVDVKPDFSKRISESSSWCKSADEAMGQAKYNAISNNKIDIVVDPIYKLTYKGRKCMAVLTGFAGYYVNPRTILEDIKQLKDVDKAEIEKYLIMEQNPQIIKYLYENKEGSTVTINHNGKCAASCPSKSEVAPATTTTAPSVTTSSSTKSNSSSTRSSSSSSSSSRK